MTVSLMFKISGLLPLLFRRSVAVPALLTLTEVSLFYGGLALLRHFPIASWELFLISFACGGISAFTIAYFRAIDGSDAIWQLGKGSWFIPSAILFILGWILFHWAGLPDIFFRTGFIPLLVSTVLCIQRLEEKLTPEAASALFRLATFIPLPIFLSILFNRLNLV